jgi:hypothetical protein
MATSFWSTRRSESSCWRWSLLLYVTMVDRRLIDRFRFNHSLTD